VWFGESLPKEAVHLATTACSCDVFITVGTSAVVYPAAGLLHHAKACGAFTAEINVDDTPASSSVDAAVQAPAEQVLPHIITLLRT
jgi:NAD-dependent deacetylase